MIEAELKAADLPLDLVYLSMIESGFSQTAFSKAKAVLLTTLIEQFPDRL
jgi:hypothetical protein